MPSAGFQTALPGSEQPQIQTLDRAATGIGIVDYSTVATQVHETVTATAQG